MHIDSLLGLFLINLQLYVMLTGWLLIALLFTQVLGLSSMRRLLCQVISLDLVMLYDLVPLDLAVGDLLRLFEVVVFLLLGVEALNLMVLQSESVAGDLWQVVDEANHCLGAIRVELVVVPSLDLRPLIDTLLLGFLVWVLSNTVFDVIAEICDEAHAILELDVECLIIDGGPLSVDGLGLTLALDASLAEDGLGPVALNQVDSVSVMRGELELVAFVHQLNLVRN